MSLFFWCVSFLPFFILHRISDFLFIVLYHVVGYRRNVVRENLKNSFPEQNESWRLEVERKFYRNFCDLVVETLKTTTLSEKDLQERNRFRGQLNADEWLRQGVNLNGLSSHLANWEWLGLLTCYSIKHRCYAVYKPLHSKAMNDFMLKSRARLGLTLVSMKELRVFFDLPHERPYLIGLLADQAPHDYGRAFEIDFLNQKTYFFSGPGILSVKHNLTPCWGWMKRTGRSRFEWGLDPVVPDVSQKLARHELAQIERLAPLYELSRSDMERAYRIVKKYAQLLEKKIREKPEDWLWSHRRWKTRS